MHIQERAEKVLRLADAIDRDDPKGPALVAAAILIASDEITEYIARLPQGEP